MSSGKGGYSEQLRLHCVWWLYKLEEQFACNSDAHEYIAALAEAA